MRNLFTLLFGIVFFSAIGQKHVSPEQLKFVRQGVQRMIFDEAQSIHLAGLDPGKIIGLPVMHPISHYSDTPTKISIKEGRLLIQSEENTQTGIWFGGFNPFATYSIEFLPVWGRVKWALSFLIMKGSKVLLSHWHLRTQA